AGEERCQALFCEEGKLVAQNGTRCLKNEFAVFVNKIAKHECSSRKPWYQACRREIRLHSEVTESFVPIGEFETVHWIHFDVYRQQVTAGMSAVASDLFQKIIAHKSFAHQPAVYVGNGRNNGIDRAGADLSRELFEIHIARSPVHVNV